MTRHAGYAGPAHLLALHAAPVSCAELTFTHINCCIHSAIMRFVKLEGPDRSELLDFRRMYGLTQKRAAKMALSSLRSWINWEHGCHQMHPAIWRYVQLAARAQARRLAAANVQALPASESLRDGGLGRRAIRATVAYPGAACPH